MTMDTLRMRKHNEDDEERGTLSVIKHNEEEGRGHTEGEEAQ